MILRHIFSYKFIPQSRLYASVSLTAMAKKMRLKESNCHSSLSLKASFHDDEASDMFLCTKRNPSDNNQTKKPRLRYPISMVLTSPFSGYISSRFFAAFAYFSEPDAIPASSDRISITNMAVGALSAVLFWRFWHPRCGWLFNWQCRSS